MNNNSTLLLVRDFVFSSQINRLDLNQIAHGINKHLNELLELFPQPIDLANKLLELDYEELNTILDKNIFDKEGAVDSIILASISVFHAFETISPLKIRFIKDLFPDLYNSHLQKKLELITDHLKNNITKGIEKCEYRDKLDIDSVLEKYLDRIKSLYSVEKLKSEHFTFATIFNNIFEDYIKEVATTENWHYFRSRKQLLGALNFGK